jgi:GT2 family glycosyltransferase
MNEPAATVVVVPRERFSMALRSLDSIYASTTGPFRLVYVDGGSPPRVRRALESAARARGFRLIRTEHYPSPNEARNLGAAEVDTRYVVFVDNDVLVSPGWLEALVERADESGAEVVGPLYLLGEPDRAIVHMAGGDAAIHETQGRRYLRERHRANNQPLARVSTTLVAGPSEVMEFHCMLVARETWRRFAPLDEALLSAMEHMDFCLSVRAAGGRLFFEPRSVVAYVPPDRPAWTDVPYLLLRWSEDWNRSSLDHFCRKWAIAEDDPMIAWQLAWLADRRRLALGPVHRAMDTFLPERVRRWIAARMTTALGRVVTARARRRRSWQAGGRACDLNPSANVP